VLRPGRENQCYGNFFVRNGVAILISGSLAEGNLVAGNFIECDNHGVFLSADVRNTTIGGTLRGMRNLIGGCAGHGVTTFGSGNLVQGNFIGPDNVVGVVGAQALIGGTSLGAGNTISGNLLGVEIAGQGTFVQGNLIGTDETGTVAMGNSTVGIQISNDATANNVVGGSVSSARNVISGNRIGVAIGDNLTHPVGPNFIQGNYIGTDVTGTTLLGQGVYGVFVAGQRNVIGGRAPGAGNVISGFEAGIRLESPFATGNVIEGNFVGTDASGARSLGNVDGVSIADADENVVGGSNGGGNVISGNSGGGVRVRGKGNRILGNLIGTEASGRGQLGNGGWGVFVEGEANTLGAADAGNRIAFNNGQGIAVGSGVGNAIRGNSVFSNNGLGIDLAGDGPTLNDPGDSDAGPNDLQNSPVLSEASRCGQVLAIEGDVNSSPNTSFAVEFFLNSSNCDSPHPGVEGEVSLGSTVVTTDGAGNAPVRFETRGLLTDGSITATATDALGNTSEFSACQAVSEARADACLTIVEPIGGGFLNCSVEASPPTITWLPGPYDRYKVFVSWDPGFPKEDRISSGDELLRKTSWTVGPRKWQRACSHVDPMSPVLYIKVLGVDRDVPKSDPRRRAFSDVIVVSVLR